MSDVLPALIGFVISVTWLLAQLGWHARIRKWYSKNINDRQGLVIPSLLVITLPFVLSYLWRSDGMKWIREQDISTNPLGILLTSSLTAIGVLITNSILKEIDRKREIYNTSKLVYEYLENKDAALRITVESLQSLLQRKEDLLEQYSLDQINAEHIYEETIRILSDLQTNIEGLDKK